MLLIPLHITCHRTLHITEYMPESHIIIFNSVKNPNIEQPYGHQVYTLYLLDSCIIFANLSAYSAITTFIARGKAEFNKCCN